MVHHSGRGKKTIFYFSILIHNFQMPLAFTKYHALGNDYLVVDPKNLKSSLTPEEIKTICHRNYGIGSDGILLGPSPSKEAQFGLRIFNPDGSEAERAETACEFFPDIYMIKSW